MKRPYQLLALTLVALTFGLAARAEVWDIDGSHTRVGFSIRHLLTPVPGQFNDFRGVIHYDPARPTASSVELVVQTASIDTANERRDGHLRSADFFDAERYPTLTFRSKRVAPLGDSLAVTGDLTFHGVTREVTVPVQVLGVLGNKAGFSTEFTIDRKDYGITWNRALDQGGTLLGDEVTIEITVEADRRVEGQPAG